MNPCSEWEQGQLFNALNAKAALCAGKPLSMAEGQFIEQASVMTVFSPKQETWLDNIFRRVAS